MTTNSSFDNKSERYAQYYLKHFCS